MSKTIINLIDYLNKGQKQKITKEFKKGIGVKQKELLQVSDL